MDDKSLTMLEFPKIRDILCGYTSFSVSHDLAQNLVPSTDSNDVVMLLKQSSEARHLLSLEPNLSIGNPVDPSESVRWATLGRILEPGIILNIRAILLAVDLLHTSIKEHADDVPYLWEVARGLTRLPQMIEEITRCIDPSGEVLDTASAELSHIRDDLRYTRRKLMNRLENIMHSESMQSMLQDHFITERAGRYVIPVKTEFQGQVKGIIHDVSNTEATVFIEPIATVELGNRIRQLMNEEEQEILRILLFLSEDVAEYSDIIIEDINLIGTLDLAFAKAKFAHVYRATEPQIVTSDNNFSLYLEEARHPLLKEKAVPITVQIGNGYSGLIITGPNTGGKTVSLKTIGLFVIMAQSGIPIPASDQSRISVFDNVFADIGDEQSIEETLSSFSWHMGNVVRIIRQATSSSLVLLDELGTSTDPAEGAALAQAIISHFLDNGIMMAATTHFGELKAFAYKTHGLQNVSMEFDSITLAPTFRMVQGVPGVSNALSIATGLGLPADIIQRASEILPDNLLEMESLVNEINREREETRLLRIRLEQEKLEIEGIKSRIEEEYQQIENNKMEIIRHERENIRRNAADLYRQIHEASAQLKKNASKEKIEQARIALKETHNRLEHEPFIQPDPRSLEEHQVIDIQDISVGDTVKVIDTNIIGTVSALFDKVKEVELHARKTRLRVSVTDVERIDQKETTAQKRSYSITIDQDKKHRSLELDLRGKRAEEVEPELDAYLNDASIAGFDQVRIVHGYGTGIVRQLVRDMLSSHPLIRSFRSGKDYEGGDGVTYVQL